MATSGFQFAIDRGGTFTDIWAKCPSGKVCIYKLLSEDPEHYKDAPSEGIKRILEKETGKPIEGLVDGSVIDWIRMGTTVATNALLEKKGERVAIVVTRGFRDLFAIGDQSRPHLFSLKIEEPCLLYEDVIEVDERIVIKQDACQLNESHQVVESITGEKLEIWQGLNADEVKTSLSRVLQNGIKNLAVALVHSYLFDEHEKAIEKLAYELGFENVTLSSRSSSMIKIVPRGSTACVDAYLTPSLKRYISSFLSGFQNLPMDKVLFMQSSGGLTHLNNFTGSRAIISGPAGGVVGYSLTTRDVSSSPVIGFDMGGTSTDVSRFAGSYEEVLESSIGGVKLLVPHLDIQTVAAGGGSKLTFHCGIFYVGPESAGANPGPACYRKGGPLTITDANLVLGRLLPDFFPKVFGETRDLPLDGESSRKAFGDLADKINSYAEEHGSKKLTVEEVALGFIDVANETMCRPIRSLTEAKGYDTSQHMLCCFGGAGGQHACAIAKSLGIRTVFIHKYSGILSAFGMALADVSNEKQEPCALPFHKVYYNFFIKRILCMKEQCIEELKLKGFETDRIETEVFLHLKYEGTDFALICSNGKRAVADQSCDFEKLRELFVAKFRQEFGFNLEKCVMVESIRVKGYGKSSVDFEFPKIESVEQLKPLNISRVFFDGFFHETPVFDYNKLVPGQPLLGPAIIIDKNSTIIVEPNCQATMTSTGDLRIEVMAKKKPKLDGGLDTIQLSIFSHRFMSIAEQMGRVLQRTAISTNIKERLDFSCALFGPDGGLVANAPHIPVHLGAMQQAVQFQIKELGGSIEEGDVLLSNHPQAGGSHLPDMTVITPVFASIVEGAPTQQHRPVFYVACRGHHADIGGTTPGSMPSSSKSIHEEGAVFRSFYLVKRGKFNEEALISALKEPAKHPGCSGSRNIKDNISDLHAQIAANNKGIILVLELISEYGLDVVQAYMKHIQATAQVAVRHMLMEIAMKRTGESKSCGYGGEVTLCGEEMMDEGYEIKLKVTINEKGSATFDFTGSSCEVYSNLNAPCAVTYAAIIYCIRCMVKEDIPLNQGCLDPIKIIIPKDSILNPSEYAAVVGGNVLTSQRVVDLIFKTFEVCAASQGCMNNVTFGDETVGYYETVGGGSGAGPTWNGRSGVHTHMTNTRITDVEVLEKRYPVVVKKFSLNKGSGGLGRHRGGDGIIREILFRKPLMLSILSERRVFSPYGMHGGSPGKRGMNCLRKKNRKINLGAKCTIMTEAGDVLRLITPGGGGYGHLTDQNVSPAYDTIQ